MTAPFWLKVLSQAFGALGMVSLFLSYQQTERKKLIAGKLGADAACVLHYLCLAAWGGAIPNFVGIFRELVFMQRDGGKKWANSPVIPAAFILLNWTLAALSWDTALTLLPIGASTFVTISLWARKPRVTRLICLPVSVCFIIYDCFVGSWIGIVNESVAIVSILVSMFRNDRPGKAGQNKNAIKEGRS